MEERYKKQKKENGKQKMTTKPSIHYDDEVQKVKKDLITTIITKPTPHLDETVQKIKKLLHTTAANYIPELFESLKQDWFPNISHDEIKSNAKIRDVLRDKILNEYCIEHTDTGIWKEKTFDTYIPDWLKNPTKQTPAQITSITKAREASIKIHRSMKNFVQKSEMQRRKLDNLAANLPKVPRELDEEEHEEIPIPQVKDVMVDEKLDDAELREITIHEAVTKLSRAEHDLWVALTGKDNMPKVDDDIIVDHIKPTRQFRNNIFYELATGSNVFKISLHSHFTRMNQLIELLQDATRTIQNIEQKETTSKK